MTVIPDFITHYHVAGREPFRNLSDLPAADLPAVLAALTGSRRRFGPRYMALRRATETRLRELFLAGGGRPDRLSPHYFVLGESPWFRGLYDDPAEVRLPLSALDDATTSFTYPDSMVAMSLGADFGLPVSPRPYHGRAFRLDELPAVVAEYGLPAGDAPADYAGHHLRTDEHFIEVQVWSDAPLLRLG